MNSETDSFVILVGGGTGSGKSTLSKFLVDMLGEIYSVLFLMDWFYVPMPGTTKEERDRRNYDHPRSLDFDLMVECLENLRHGRPVEAPRWDFKSHERELNRYMVFARRVLVVEGILALHDPRIRAMANLMIFVDTPDWKRLIRRVRRDKEERGRPEEQTFRQWEETVQAMHDEFCYPSRTHADLIVPGGGENPVVHFFLQQGLDHIAKQDPDKLGPLLRRFNGRH